MEELKSKIKNIVGQKHEVVGIHANAILHRDIADEREINKRMDALCMDENIAKNILGEEIYKVTKSQLQISKPFFNPDNKDEILALPEFQYFLKKHILEQEKIQQQQTQRKELEAKNTAMAELDLPQDIQNAKIKVNNIKATIRGVIDEKQEKNEGSRKTAMDIIKKTTMDESQKKEKSDQIYDFIFEHMESPGNRKKRRTGESSSDFYKRIGIDYMFNEIRKSLQEEEKKINEKINKWKEKAKLKLKVPKQEKQEKKDYTKEAVEIFRKQMEKYPSIQDRFYLPKDKEDINHIQEYFKRHLEETIKSPNMEKLIKDYNTPLHTIERAGNKIKTNPNDYIEIERRKMEYKKRFINEGRNSREYIFDRLVEYVGQDILKYKINDIIHTEPKYAGTEFSIEKTDVLDDSFAGTDYIVTYSIPGKQKKRIAAIDLFISDKTGGMDEEESEDKRKQKKESAKGEMIPYSTYIDMFSNKKENSYVMEPLKRYVEQQDPMLIYTVLAQTLRNPKTNISKLLQSYESKGELYALIQNTSSDDTRKNKAVERQFHQNILNELEKIAA